MMCHLNLLLNGFYSRFVWNLLRLENEHLNNCGKFRAVRDIGIKPIQDSDQEQLIKLMDGEPETVAQLIRRKGRQQKGKPTTVEGEHDSYATVSSIASAKNWLQSLRASSSKAAVS